MPLLQFIMERGIDSREKSLNRNNKVDENAIEDTKDKIDLSYII